MAFCSSWTKVTTIQQLWNAPDPYNHPLRIRFIGDSTLRDVDVLLLLCAQLCVVTVLKEFKLSEQHCNHGVCRFRYELSDSESNHKASMLQTSLTGGCILTGDGRWHVLIRLIGWIFLSLILYRLSQSHLQHWHWQATNEKDAWQQPVWLHTSRSQTPLSVFRPPLVVFAHLPLFFTSHCLINSLLKEGFARLKQALRINRQRSNSEGRVLRN